jgi:hypothetical protein
MTDKSVDQDIVNAATLTLLLAKFTDDDPGAVFDFLGSLSPREWYRMTLFLGDRFLRERAAHRQVLQQLYGQPLLDDELMHALIVGDMERFAEGASAMLHGELREEQR